MHQHQLRIDSTTVLTIHYNSQLGTSSPPAHKGLPLVHTIHHKHHSSLALLLLVLQARFAERVALLLVLTIEAVDCVPPFAFFCGDPHFAPLAAGLLKFFLGLIGKQAKLVSKNIITHLIHKFIVQNYVYLTCSSVIFELGATGAPVAVGKLGTTREL